MEGEKRERKRGAHLLRHRVAVRPVLLPRRSIREKTANERREHRLRIVSRAHPPVSQLQPLDPLPQLFPRIEYAIHRLDRDEVVLAPDLPLAGPFELLEGLEDVKQHEVVPRSMNELATRCRCSVARRRRVDEELVGRAEERDEVDDLARAAFGEGGEEDAGVDGVEGELSHLATDGGDVTFLVESVEAVKGEEGSLDYKGRASATSIGGRS